MPPLRKLIGKEDIATRQVEYIAGGSHTTEDFDAVNAQRVTGEVEAKAANEELKREASHNKRSPPATRNMTPFVPRPKELRRSK